jgi:hypothetical protein
LDRDVGGSFGILKPRAGKQLEPDELGPLLAGPLVTVLFVVLFVFVEFEFEFFGLHFFTVRLVRAHRTCSTTRDDPTSTAITYTVSLRVKITMAVEDQITVRMFFISPKIYFQHDRRVATT